MDAFSAVELIASLYLYSTNSPSPSFTRPVENALLYLKNFLFWSAHDASRVFLSGGPKLPAIVCLHYSKGKKCAVLHDHIYATLGLQHRQLIQADYNMPLEELYTKVALHPNVRHYNFQNAGLGVSRRVTDLPSWVPDWSVPLNPSPWTLSHAQGNYSTGGSLPKNLDIEQVSEKVIRIAGFQEDEVYLLGGHGFTSAGNPIDVTSILMCFRLLISAFTEPYDILSTEIMVERMARTWMLDLELRGRTWPTTESLQSSFRDYVTIELTIHLDKNNDYGIREEMQGILETILERDRAATRFLPTCRELEQATREVPQLALNSFFIYDLGNSFYLRRFFIMTKGRMGIASDKVEFSDAIMVVENYEWPLLMRRGTEERWLYISGAYVEGTMHREALEGNSFGNIDIE
ncbi:hypothetical protein BU23DRAFT_573351 [Bimuria novae-zelandiae CBS 107.79]|uniref:Heterokaryon incompatibility domain-containing protein n=1 Tax=Bimuria novae-zelandiae CBS 107.79 TaxID=1447943 RepID=A0A6A5USH1_9PLEO|nr:hypothetical protein BU23DRAFT_573351 [Bimuria novae-zelandiae CBS 107.79]